VAMRAHFCFFVTAVANGVWKALQISEVIFRFSRQKKRWLHTTTLIRKNGAMPPKIRGHIFHQSAMPPNIRGH